MRNDAGKPNLSGTHSVGFLLRNQVVYFLRDLHLDLSVACLPLETVQVVMLASGSEYDGPGALGMRDKWLRPWFRPGATARHRVVDIIETGPGAQPLTHCLKKTDLARLTPKARVVGSGP